MKQNLPSITAVMLLSATAVQAQTNAEPMAHRHFVGSSAWVMIGALMDESPEFYQLNYGYRLTTRDVVSVEAITWKYGAPLGIPYGPAFGAAEEDYPGSVKGVGVGVAYQRFLWRDAYAAVHALPLSQRHSDESGTEIQKGFQLFLTYRLGYQVQLPGDRFFLEPSIAATHWPINTNVPEAFAARDAKWPNHFLAEPGLHFGVRF